MWKLSKNKAGKFEIAYYTSNGRQFVKSRQGYNNRKDAVTPLLELGVSEYKDETGKSPVMYFFDSYIDKWVREKKYEK